MKKLSIAEIEEALVLSKVEPAQKEKVINELMKIAAAENEAKAPKSKNEFGIVLYSDDLEIQKMEFTASVYSVKEGFDHNTVLGKISEAIKESNELAKRKNNIITSIGDAFQNLKRKFIKNRGINLKSKNVCRVLVSSNKVL